MLSNRYRRRQVAETDSKACFVCYKPTTCVLSNEVPTADFFYTCEQHLQDPGFATPEEPPREQTVDLSKEIAELKSQWDQVRDKHKGDKEKGDKEKKDDKPENKPKDTENKPKNTENKPKDTKISKPTWYRINPQVLRLRNQAKKRIAQESQTRKMLASPNIFPKVPQHPLPPK